MATPNPCNSEPDHLICSVCLEKFKNPKLLPCYHSFCEACIEALVTKSHTKNGTFECPQCRKKTRLTRDKVPLLQSNFYLTPFLENIQDHYVCDYHEMEKLRFVCVNCKEVVCCECILQNHRKHDLEDIGKARKKLRGDLQESQTQIDYALEELKSKLQVIQRHRQMAETERQSVLNVLKTRARELHAVIEGQLQKALTSVTKMVHPVEKEESGLAEKIRKVQLLQEEMREVLAKSPGYSIKHLLKSYRDMQKNKQMTLDGIKLSAEKDSCQYSFPGLHCDNSLPRGSMIASLLGQVYTAVPMATMLSPVALHQAFRIQGSLDDSPAMLSVQALCVGSGQMWAAFRARSAEDDSWVCQFSRTGRALSTPVAVKGRVCLAGLPHGWVRVEGKDFHGKDIPSYAVEVLNSNTERLYYDVYNKTQPKFLVRLYTNQTCELRSVGIVGCKDSFVCKLLVQTPVAMDASQDGTLFAMLEEGQNHVSLYHRDGDSKPFSIFRGKPSEPFEPQDVCFCTLDGQERLVVADGVSKTLMILKVDKDSGSELMEHIKVTLPGPSAKVVKPTALCPDTEGRLWIGCEGGYVLYIVPMMPDTASADKDWPAAGQQ